MRIIKCIGETINGFLSRQPIRSLSATEHTEVDNVCVCNYYRNVIWYDVTDLSH